MQRIPSKEEEIEKGISYFPSEIEMAELNEIRKAKSDLSKMKSKKVPIGSSLYKQKNSFLYSTV